ncbi:MAG: putative transposase [Clostridia bacterium]|nr:putative transposase [Clostridia bacterium]
MALVRDGIFNDGNQPERFESNYAVFHDKVERNEFPWVIECECGWKGDRDVNAALVILRKGLGLSPNQAAGLDPPELKPPEREAAVRILGSNPYLRVSFS